MTHGVTIQPRQVSVDRIAIYRALAAQGLSMAETARRCGVCHRAVWQAARRHEIAFRRGKGRPGPEVWTEARRARQSEAMRAYHRELAA